MKILHLIHKPQNRGAETFACQLANHQKGLGHEVKIVAIYPGNITMKWEEPIETLDGTESKILDFKAWKKLNCYIKHLNPDIVQANSGDTLKYAVFSKKIFGWKNPIIFRNASEVGGYLNSFLQKQMNYYFYKEVAGVASVSEASKKDIIKHFPFLQNKTQVIPVGLEPCMKITPFSLSPEGKKHIVHVGGFSFEKNHKGLIEIFKLVLSESKDVYLHLVGDGPLKSEIETLVINEGLKSYVSFYGFVNNPLDYIGAGDVLVLPSIIEGLPGVLLEAMHLKVPVVANKVGGISEIVMEDTGTLVTRGANKEFAKKILDILNFRQEKRILENAYTLVQKNYMNQKLTLDFLKFYRKISTSKNILS